MHAMTFLAAHADRPHSTKEMAQRLSASDAHLSKVMQRLHKGGLAASIRGPKGGFAVEGDATAITLLNVYECIEGEIKLCDCLLPSPVCSGKSCIFGGLPLTVSARFRNYLEAARISDFAHLWS
jgi:Rrf2 family protein